MKKKKLTIHLITSTTQEQYNILGEYDKETGKYNLVGEGRSLTTDELIDFYSELVTKYPIISIYSPVFSSIKHFLLYLSFVFQSFL